MAKIDVKYPTYGNIEVSKFGKSKTGNQRYICNNKACKSKTFQLEHSYNGRKPHIEPKITYKRIFYLGRNFKWNNKASYRFSRMSSLVK